VPALEEHLRADHMMPGELLDAGPLLGLIEPIGPNVLINPEIPIGEIGNTGLRRGEFHPNKLRLGAVVGDAVFGQNVLVAVGLDGVENLFL
jgi:hypothetical protein